MSALLYRLDAAWNPIWIKEVRQAMRSRYFRITYLLSVLASASLAVLMLTVENTRQGASMFGVVYAALAFGVVGLVPFSVYFNTPSESAGRALDLVLLTNLKPWRIALGRMLGAATQSALIAGGTVPFLALSTLLPGLDLDVAALLLLETAVASLSASAVALGMATVMRTRLLRGLGAVLLVGILLQGATTFLWMGMAVTFGAGTLTGSPGAMLGYALGVAFTAAVGVYGFGAATAALAHPEENRSTPLRLATLAVAAVGLIALGWGAHAGATDRDSMLVTGMTLVGFIGFPLVFFLTEPPRLGRRLAVRLPRWALLVAPLLPGGGRGVLYALCVLGGLAWVLPQMIRLSTGLDQNEGLTFLIEISYGLIYLLLPAGIIGDRVAQPSWRWLARLLPFALFLAGLILPLLMGLILDVYSLRNGDHPGNPFWLLAHAQRGDADASIVALVLAAAVAALALNLPRVIRGIRELVP